MGRTARTAAFELLIVEDDAGDVMLTREALSGSRIPHNLQVVGDGEAAVAYLRGEGRYAGAVRPDLVLLDLNLPRLDGREVLARVKADPDLRSIPIVILTTSSAHEDVARSYDLHANAFVTKPADLEAFNRVVRQVDEFFLTVTELPTRA
jgi:CheY-like chemotaxis protein